MRPQRRRAMSAQRRRAVLATGVAASLLAVLCWRVTTLPDGELGRPVDAMSAPRGAPTVTTQGPYESLVTDGDEPVRFDPCLPIHLEVNRRTEPDGADGLLEEAVREVAAATGLVLVVDGTTERSPAEEMEVRHGERPPVLVAWTDPDEIEGLEGATAGLGGPVSMDRRGQDYLVTGQVALDGPQLERILSGHPGRAGVRAVIMHELAHVVGLGHVEDEAELMHARTSILTWGPGDRAGLAAMGSGPCEE